MVYLLIYLACIWFVLLVHAHSYGYVRYYLFLALFQCCELVGCTTTNDEAYKHTLVLAAGQCGGPCWVSEVAQMVKECRLCVI